MDSKLTAQQGRRAVGSMFMIAFGTAWLMLGGWQATRSLWTPAVLLAVPSTVLFSWSGIRFRRAAAALAAEPDSPQLTRGRRIFRIVNVVQWVVILIGANILANLNLASWTVPLVIFVVGLHFVPIAFALGYRPHLVTGAFLMVLAADYPQVASGGPVSSSGAFGAGVILWASAIWSMTSSLKSRP